MIEVIVVVLVIAVVLAIAIPTFLGARARAQHRQAHSNLRNALTAQRAIYAAEQRYASDPTELATWEPGLDWTQPNAPTGGVVAESLGGVIDPGVDVDGDGGHNCSVNTSNGVTTVSGDCSLDADMVCLVSKSASGRTFLLADVATGVEAGTYYNEASAVPPTAPASEAGLAPAGEQQKHTALDGTGSLQDVGIRRAQGGAFVSRA